MKGFFVKAIEKLVIEETGLAQREPLLNKAGFKPNELFIIRTEINDTKVKKLIKTAVKILDTDETDFFEKYGEYWVNEYASLIFKQIFQNSKTAKDFLEQLFRIHAEEETANPLTIGQKLMAEFSKNKMVLQYDDSVMLKLIESIIRKLYNKYGEKAEIKTTTGKKIELIYK